MNNKNSFEKKYRLLNKGDFLNMRSENHFFSSGPLLFFVKSNSKDNSRLGMAISKKYGCAVKRNRLKRILRNEFRISDRKHEKVDILVVPNLKKIKSQGLDYSTIERGAGKAINKALEANFGI